MSSDALPFTTWQLAFIGLYLLSLLVVGYVAMRSRAENSLQDFYLGGSGIGLVVLLLTLYATQYSGNTLFGFTGKTYVVGYRWAVCIHFMTAIVVFYLLFAPKLHQLARQRGYITPTDFLYDRYGSRTFALLGAIVMIVGMANYLLAQLKAMGEALEGFSSSNPAAAYAWGVIALALIIVAYETLGGFRAVVWTDVIQGSVLMFGFVVLAFLLFEQFGTLADATATLAVEAPQKIAPPDANGGREWLSWVLLVGIGGALYPQAIQRIYAARSAKTLRRSLAVMAFLPLTTTLIAVLFGVMAAANLPAAEGGGDEVLAVVCRRIHQNSVLGGWLVTVLFAAILAALMSTADSVLLCISSMLTKDFYAVIRPHAEQPELTRFGKRCSWLLIASMAALAIALRETTLVTLLKIKFEILVQLSPAFILGLHWKKLHAGPLTWGLVCGSALAVGLALTGHGRPWGIHAGLYGLALNAALAIGGSLLWPETRAESRNSKSTAELQQS